MLKLVEIGARIKRLREEANLTQSKVADYLSVDQSMVAKMEKGERNISVEVIDKLAALFCYPVEYILSGENQKNKNKCVVAFRANTVNKNDLKSLAIINKIVLNQFEMDEIAGGNNNV